MNAQNLYPYLLAPVTKSPIWGGTRLKEEYGIPATEATVGEAWMLSVRKEENCTVENGIFQGKTLGEVLSKHPEQIGEGHRGETFPLLIKLIDAADRLSVQVHPDDAYAAANETGDARGKTEMWYIVDADPDAELIYGLADGVGRDEFRRAVEAGDYTSVLCRTPVRAGETYFIPSGMLHAIGRGILIAEIQQNCDLTYRVYDYDRRDKNGNPRELHVKKALDVTRPFTQDEIDRIRYACGRGDGLLASCTYFSVRAVTPNGEQVLTVGKDSFQCVLPLGRIKDAPLGGIRYGGNEYPLLPGKAYFLPAGMGEYTLHGNTRVLISSI